MKTDCNERSTSNFNVFKELWFWVLCAAMFTIKILLIPAYHSTDFEVHRNWMAVTSKLPLREWYRDETSKWTLDYPPLFAYFEYFLSKGMNMVDPAALVVQADPYFSSKLLVYHRFTVIICDLIYAFACGFLANSVGTLRYLETKKSDILAVAAIPILLITNVALIMVDNVHFQYNGLLTAVFLVSFGFYIRKKPLLAAFFFCVLLNMKHIYVYYVPAFFVLYVTEYFLPTRNLVQKFVKLTAVMCLPFAVSFGPFLYYGGMNSITEILKRLFPFQRGLTHAYWAPNIWAIYNFLDWFSYKVLKLAGRLPVSAKPPAYTTGLVQEYEHSIFPTVTPRYALFATVLLFYPCLRKLSCRSQNFPQLLSLSAFAFFLASYHVHEKAIIIVTVPYTILALNDHRFLSSMVLLNTVANVSLFPLLFTPLESLLKVALTIFYYCVSNSVAKFVCPRYACSQYLKSLFLMLIVFVQIFCILLCPLLLNRRFTFVPLMVTSVTSAVVVLYIYVELIFVGSSSKFRPLCKCNTMQVSWENKMKSSTSVDS